MRTITYTTVYVERDDVLKALEQEPCEDCISRAGALRHSHIEYDDDGEGHKVIYTEDIEELPSVTPDRPKGKWIEHEVRDTCRWLTCSICGYEWINKKENYCPNCGAEMSGGEEDEVSD